MPLFALDKGLKAYDLNFNQAFYIPLQVNYLKFY